MTDIGIKIGTHDTGFWDAENEIIANKKSLVEGVNINEAISKAKQNPGAELIIVNKNGKAEAHTLFVKDSLIQENKTINIKDLDRDPNPKQDLKKTPLAIDDYIAQAFRGEAAFLVDE